MSTTTGRRGNGEGSAISQRADGRYCAAIRYLDAHGKPKRAYVYGKTKAEVRDKLKDARRRVEDGRPAVDAALTVGGYGQRWVVTSLAASDRATSTKELYEMLLRVHVVPRLGAVRLDQLRPTHVEGLVAELRTVGKSSSTIRSVYTVLRQLLDTAVRDGLLARNPAAAVPRPKATHREVEALDAAGVRALLEAASGHRLYALIVVLAHCGLRRGEALALRWEDVDLEAGRIAVRGSLGRTRANGLSIGQTKTAKSRRVVPLTPLAADALRQRRTAAAAERLRAGSAWVDSRHVFSTEDGRPLDPRNVNRWVKKLPGAAGLVGALHPHVLRHSTATVMLEAGVAVPVVGDLLGHSSYSITADVYSHVLDRMKTDAVQVLGAAFDAQAR